MDNRSEEDMAGLGLTIRNKNNEILAQSSGEDSVFLLYKDAYEPGDTIELTVSCYPQHIIWQVDDALGESMCYMTGESDTRFLLMRKRRYIHRRHLVEISIIFMRELLRRKRFVLTEICR